MLRAGRWGEHGDMLIALLILLGVNLIVVVALLGIVFTRRRWVSQQPGDFKGAIRLVEGDASGLGPKWKRGHGRWVRDVLVWTKAPFMFRTEQVAVDDVAGDVRVAGATEVKRLGKAPVIVPIVAEGGARIEVAVSESDRERALGPWGNLAGRAAAKRRSG